MSKLAHLVMKVETLNKEFTRIPRKNMVHIERKKSFT